jgi:hypothetical protein
MSLEINPFASISIRMFPDGRLDAKNAALYLGLKEKTLAVMRGNRYRSAFYQTGSHFLFQRGFRCLVECGRAVGKYCTKFKTIGGFVK